MFLATRDAKFFWGGGESGFLDRINRIDRILPWDGAEGRGSFAAVLRRVMFRLTPSAQSPRSFEQCFLAQRRREARERNGWGRYK